MEANFRDFFTVTSALGVSAFEAAPWLDLGVVATAVVK